MKLQRKHLKGYLKILTPEEADAISKNIVAFEPV